MKTKCNQPKRQAEDETQMYSVVDTGAKKEKKQKQEMAKDIESLLSQEISEMYAVVDKNVKKRRQGDCIHDQYAQVGKTAKNISQNQDNLMNEFVVDDETADNSVIYHELKNVIDEYAVVDKSAIRNKQTL